MEDFDSIVPFTGEQLPVVSQETSVLGDVAAQREIAEVQAAMTIAKRFPRNQIKATERILVACQRPSLAESALYSYAKGGTDITGPSIRLAEAIAQQWGNLQFGIRELDQRVGESTVEAYAWDLETNTRQVKVFQVKHFRKTKKGSYTLDDPRDIYEMVANQGARRMRACILGVIPGDVVEMAVAQCESTLKAKADISPDAVQKMLKAFEAYGVSKSQIEARIQRKLESITSAQVIALRKIYNSLKDGMSKPEDWFDAVVTEVVQEKTRKPRSDKGQPRKPDESAQEGGGETISPGPDESPKDNGDRLADKDTIEEIYLYAHQIGLSDEQADGKASEFRADGAVGVKQMTNAEAGRFLGWLLDQVSEKQ